MMFSNSKKLLSNICRCSMMSRGLFIAIFATSILGSPAVAGDLEKGKKTFVKCGVCHAVEKDVSKIGPSLYGVYGRQAGSLESFANYSDAIKAMDIVWGDDTIRELLKAPRTYIPGTKMIFIGIKSDEEIDNLLAYLKTVTGADTSEPETGSETSNAETGAETSDASSAVEASPVETAIE